MLKYDDYYELLSNSNNNNNNNNKNLLNEFNKILLLMINSSLENINILLQVSISFI